MNSKSKVVLFCVLIASLMIISFCQVFAITYLNIYVEGSLSNTHIQGQDYTMKLDCTPMDTVHLEIIPDLNGNGEVDPGEISLVPSDANVIDNGEPIEGNPLIDSDPTEGLISIDMVVHLYPGDWIIRFSDMTTSAVQPLHVYPPDPLEHSVSGRLMFEDMAPPDEFLDGILILAGTMSPMMLIFCITDSMGDFTFNWPGDPADLIIMVTALNYDVFDSLGYDYDALNTFVHVAGHITDFNILIPFLSIDDGNILCRIIKDEDDPSPVNLNQIHLILYLSDGVTPDREMDCPLDGTFSFNFVTGDATYYLGLHYMGAGNIFIEKNFVEIYVPPGEDAILEPIYVDNGNAQVNIHLDGIDPVMVLDWSIMMLSDIPEVDAETLSIPLNDLSLNDTLYLCDATWTIIPPEIEGCRVTPSGTTLTINEDIVEYDITFLYTMEGIEDFRNSNIPDKITLSRNFPDPFNSSTFIYVGLPQSNHAAISLYNLKGEKVQDVFSGFLNAGYHQIEINADNCQPSGVYFISFSTNKHRLFEKTLFLK
ncbi:T9SS type A sorting domain-containing protein [bacterium]|nr:T9SS type A sorting domain-containing protein [bacterium]